MGAWQQSYDPLHFRLLSVAVSTLPLLTLLYVLLVLKWRVWKAALSGLLAALVLSLTVFRMPLGMIGSAALLGILIGWLRIAWVLVASIYLYNIAVATGQFVVMKSSVARLAPDKRVQVILVAFCVGAFLEGTGMSGSPVALTGTLLVGLGFPPLQAAKVCLLSNTVPLAWGGIGNPMLVLAASSGLPQQALSAMTGRILPVLSAVLPLWLVNAIDGWEKTREVLPAVLVSGISFAVIQAVISNLGYGAWVDIAAAVGSLLAMVALLRVWRPKTIIENPEGVLPGVVPEAKTASTLGSPRSIVTILKGWSALLLACLLILIGGIPAVSRVLNLSVLRQPVPLLNNQVIRMPPVVARPTPEVAIADLNIVAMHGTAVFLGATISALLLGLSLRRALRIFGQTVARLVHSLLGVSFMIGFLFVYRYSGMITAMGLALTRTGPLLPFFGTFMGWLGTTLSGADAVSNSLFGYLQKATAERAGLNPVLMAAANASGGVMGKMMDPQTILVSSIATQQAGNEGNIFKTAFKHSVILTSFLGLIVLLYSVLFSAPA